MVTRARWLGAAALLGLLASSAAAQGQGQGRRQGQGDEPPAAEQSAREPMNCFEFAVSGDGLGVAYRNAFHRGSGYATVGFFAGEDDDYALSGRWMRFGEPSSETPLGLGIGLGVMAATIDEPDSEVVAITLTGSVDYELRIQYPLRVGVDLTFAPDVATFSDGERVLDLLARCELDLSTWATAFVGYRQFEMDLDQGGEHELESSVHGGVRLGF